MNTELIVSVSMITYKHEAFIAQAIEGVLMQETNFDIELIIADDCSPDKTKEIVNNFILTHPKGNLIKYFRHHENIGMQSNGAFAGQQCKGKYVAICEGDDYWTDKLKLQKQVDLIEKNSNCNIVFHNCMIINQFGNDVQLVYEGQVKTPLTIIDLINGKFTKTCTVLLRNGCINNERHISDDTVIFMEALENGNTAIYINEVMSVYRIHEGGVWSMKSPQYRFLESEIIENYIEQRYYKRYPVFIQDRLKNFYFSQSIQLLVAHFYRLSAIAFLKYVKKESSPFNGLKNILKYFKWLLFGSFKKSLK